jgi:hypothetical protein
VAGACGLTLASIEFQKELEDEVSAENEDWSYVLDQRELKAGKTVRAAYLTVYRCEERDYQELLTRLFHQNYRNGAACTYVRDLEKPGRLAPGQQYGFYTLEAAEGEYPWRAGDKGQ